MFDFAAKVFELFGKMNGRLVYFVQGLGDPLNPVGRTDTEFGDLGIFDRKRAQGWM